MDGQGSSPHVPADDDLDIDLEPYFQERQIQQLNRSIISSLHGTIKKLQEQLRHEKQRRVKAEITVQGLQKNFRLLEAAYETVQEELEQTISRVQRVESQRELAKSDEIIRSAQDNYVRQKLLSKSTQ